MEVLVGIFIFSLGLVSIFMLLTSSLNLNERNKNQIIASNLAREQIELIRNVRDTNYETLHPWNLKNPYNSVTDIFEVWKYYKIENNFSGGFSVLIDEIVDFWEWVSEITGKMQDYRLYITSDGLYTYNSVWNTPTYFYRYTKIEPVTYTDGATVQIPNAMKVTSTVIWYKRWYHQIHIETILTDWRRI